MSVEVTLFGYLVIPICLVLLFIFPSRLLPLVILLAPFQAASVLNIYLGDYPIGVQPGYLAAAFLVASVLGRLLIKGHLLFSRYLLFMYVPLFLFAAYAVISAILLPRLFEGDVSVFTPREGLKLESLSPLSPSLTNLSQAAYIVFLAVFAITVSLKIRGLKAGRLVARMYLLAGCLVVFIGLWQLGASYLALPFPYELLYSNPGYSQQYGQTIGEVQRLSSTFVEPSVAAYYLVGVFSFALWSYLFSARRSVLMPVLCMVFATGLLLTTSTTAYLTLGVILAALSFQTIRRRGLPIRSARLAAIAAPATIAVLVFIYTTSGSDAIGSTIDTVLLEKTKSESFTQRTGTIVNSFSLLMPTGGFGVGWGSDRSSSLFSNMLSNAGLWGSALFAWFGLRVLGRLFRATKSADNNREQRDLMRAFAASIFAMLIAGVIAVPDLTMVSFWLNLAILIGLVSAAEWPNREKIASESNLQYVYSGHLEQPKDSQAPAVQTARYEAVRPTNTNFGVSRRSDWKDNR